MSLLPWWAKALILAALAAAAFWIVRTYNETLREEGRAEVQQAWDKESAERATAALEEARENARETLRRLEKQKEVEDAYLQDRARLAADAARARTAADSLRQHVADLEALAGGVACRDPAAAGQRETASAAARMLVELQRRADERAGVLARFADEARAAGLNCERRYDALIR